MKKINILLVLAIFFMAGCDLDKMPETDFTDLDYWKTEKDLRGACNRLYSEDPTTVTESERIKYLEGFSHDARADEIITGSANSVSSGSKTETPSEDNTNWRNPYRRIYVSNNIIDKSVNAEVTDNIRNRWVAEARFFRAYNYFELVKKFGGVPLVLKSFDSTDDPEIYKGRNPREEVVAQIYADLDFAAEWLPAHFSLPAADWGRVTQSSALALKARVGLYIGTLNKYHGHGDHVEHLKKSIAAAEEVMKVGHDLYPDFQELFYFEGEGVNNKENIFVKVYGPNESPTVVHGNSRALENSAMLTRQMVDMFLYSDGLPRDKSPLKPDTEPSYDTALENRDPRLTMTVYKIGEIAYKGTWEPFSVNATRGYPIKKGFMLTEWATSGKESVDKMLIRYAEVLIGYAEALYELNGSITDTQLENTVNKLRSRAGFDVKLTNDFVRLHGLDMLTEIRRERTIEFIDEGFRYDDIIRWKIAEDVLPVAMLGPKYVESECSIERSLLEARLTDANGMHAGAFVYDEPDMYVIETASSRKFDPKRDYLYPIPTREIALTGGKIEQNPFW